MSDQEKPKSHLSQVIRSHPDALALTHSLWAPPTALCLRAAARRLAELMRLLPQEFAVLQRSKGLPTHNQIINWVMWLESGLRGVSTPNALAQALAISPAAALERPSGQQVRHPLSGYGMSEFSIYSLLLITPPSNDIGRAGFDRIVAWTTLYGIAEHLSYSQDEYLHFAESFHDYKTGGLAGKAWHEVAPFQLSKQGRLDGARRGIAALQQSATLSPVIARAEHARSIDDIIRVIEHIIGKLPIEPDGKLGRQAAQIAALLTLLNDRPLREYNTAPTEPIGPSSGGVDEPPSSPPPARPKPTAPLEERDGTYYELETLFLEAEAPTDTDISIPLYYTDDGDDDDWDDDLPEEEQLGPPIDEITLVDREDQLEPSTLQIWSQNKLDFARRLAEHQPYGLDYVCMDTRQALVAALSRLRIDEQEEQTRLAASFILASLVTGRRLLNLLGGVLAHDSLDARTDDHLIIVNPAAGTLLLRLNKPELRLAPAQSSIVAGEWIAAPDHFGLCSTLRALSLAEQVRLSQTIEKILSPLLTTHQLRLEQLSQLLPRTMLETEGSFCTASLLTDWTVGNIAVNRHYLTPAASTVASRYAAALESMLGLSGLTAPAQPHAYVGHPNTPPVSEIQRTIHELAGVTPGMSLQMRHNHITVHTALMLSLAIGLRATVNIKPGGIQLLDKSIAHLTEKGFTRLVCLPDLLAEQLIAYEQHLSLLRAVWQRQHGTDKPHENLFFMFNDAGAAEPFSPKKLGEYLGALGIESDLEIRSLRRMVFTWLYEHGGFGRAVDHFISHAVNGSQAFVRYSGVQIGDLRKIADFINEKLVAMDWPIAAGINHHHAAFRR